MYGNEINTSLKTVSVGEALFKAILPCKTFLAKKNQDKQKLYCHYL